MTDEVIDRAALQRLMDVIGGDPEDLQELLDEFEDSAPRTVAQMRDATAAGDLDALRIAAHTLKGNARDFGATALSGACTELEAECRAGTVRDPQGQVEAIAEELDRARAALSDMAVRE